MLCGVTATLGSNPSATATAARPQWGRAVLLCLDGVWARARVCVLGPGCLVCPWAAGYLADGLACGAAGVPGAVGPGRPRDRHTRAYGSEWSISKPALALRALRHPPHRRRLCRCVWLGASSRSPARPRPAHGHRSLALRALHTGGACVAVTSPARPYRMGTAAWVSGLSTQWCPVADADWRVVSKPGQASPRPWAPQPGPPCPPAPSIPAVLVSLCVAGRVVSKLGQAPSPPMGTAAWPSGTLRTGGACVAVTSPARPCRRPRAPQSTGSTAWPSRSCGALHAGRANPLRGR